MAALSSLGEPPKALGHEFERAFVYVETAAYSGEFGLLAQAEAFDVRSGSGDQIPTATIRVRHEKSMESHPDYTDFVRDWQVLNSGGVPLSAHLLTMGGRRVQIRTARQAPADDWVLFEGFITAHVLGWSGASQQHRVSRMHAVGTIAAADFDLSQKLFGQWRRNLRAELARRGVTPGGEDAAVLARECVRVGVPLVFNPAGRPNAHYYPITFADETSVYVPTDPEDSLAAVAPTNRAPRPFTVARMLRYLQWAAMQPRFLDDEVSGGNQYDRLHVSKPYGVETAEQLSGAWTPFDLKWGNLSALIEPLLSIDEPAGASDDARRRALLQVLPDVAIDGMSVLEAIVYICDRAGILFHSEQNPDQYGRVQTSAWFTLRGDRADNDPLAPPAPVSGGGPTDIQVGEAEDASQANPATSRGVYIYVPADRFESGSGGLSQFSEFNAQEGEIGIDESATRNGVLEVGSPATFEGAWACVPGWRPDDWWDVNTGSPAAISTAQERIGTSPWNAKYKADEAASVAIVRQYGKVGRYWALNEHARFTPSLYKRTAGPWSTDAAWHPYDFSDPTAGNVFELAVRRTRGWSIRRRRFLPTRARSLGDATDENGVRLGVRLLVSYDSGSTYYPRRCNLRVVDDEAAVMIEDADLAAASLAAPEYQTTGAKADTFPGRFIAGTVRIKVLADVEGDDASWGVSIPRPSKQLNKLSSWDLAVRRDQYRRQLRLRPNASRQSAANATMLFGATDEASFLSPSNRDDSIRMQAEAVRIGRELELRRHNGQFTIPWLARGDRRVLPPVGGYCIGDEVLGIKTQVPLLDIAMAGLIHESQPSARIVAVSYSYTPDEQSTSLIVEDAAFHADAVQAQPESDWEARE